MPVKILADHVIAKIAAGEVVDRPSSVIKELIENSLDAKATAIEIHLKDAGKESMIIKDNGTGIAPDDLKQLFYRHATSKITSIDDLETLASMGFRGEALYSIGAVSDVVIKTKLKNPAETTNNHSLSPEGWQLHVQGGKHMALEPVALATHGTEIHISQLFFNTPARRKFLKNNTSEINSIVNVITPYCLIYPSIRFLLTSQDKTIIDVRPATTIVDRISDILNVPSKQLINTQEHLSSENITISLVLGNINIQRSRRDMQYIIINKRPVESKNISFAINDIYRLILPPSVYGAFVLQIDLDPSTIDVNIHPTKREVRLKDEYRIIALLRRLTENTLMQQGQVKVVPFTASRHSLQSPPFASNTAGPLELAWPTTQATHHVQDLPDQLFDQAAPVSSDTLHTHLSRSRYIGHFMNKYQLFDDGQQLLIIDHHAAQERIMFEKFHQQIQSASIETQPLLTPILLPLSIAEKITWEDIKDTLTALGIETTLFDQSTLAIQTQPLLLRNIERSVRDILAQKDIIKCDRETIAKRACKASIVAGDAITPQEADYQRRELLKCHDPFTCPHGRPTVISLTDGFFERQFLRI